MAQSSRGVYTQYYIILLLLEIYYDTQLDIFCHYRWTNLEILNPHSLTMKKDTKKWKKPENIQMRISFQFDMYITAHLPLLNFLSTIYQL